MLINEFGEIGLDHHLLERIDDNIVAAAVGLPVLHHPRRTVGGDLDLHGARAWATCQRFRRTRRSRARASPIRFPILPRSGDPVLRHHFRLGNVITDGRRREWQAQLAHQPECTKQVAVADRLVLTKTDLADTDTVNALSARLRRLNPSAPLSRATEAPLDAEALLSHDLFATAGRSEAARRWFAAEVAPREDEPGHDRNRHDETIHAFAFTFDGPLDWTLFGLWLTMLLNRHGEKLLRVKGILNVAGSPAPVAVHGVQHLVHPPIHMTAWPDADRRSRLVFVVDGLDRGLIERSLRAFLRLGSSALSPAAA